jgi:predicted transcriptional regulator
MTRYPPHHVTLSRPERQIMDILYRRGRATAGEVMAELTGDPSYSTARTQLRVLEDKGHVYDEELGLHYVVYLPSVPRRRRSALRHLVETFFDGSSEQAVAALLAGQATRPSDDDLERIADVTKARKDARR